ncbi:3-deoxy-D-manno-octulosonic acid transferase [Candidatus Pelagibacter sp.]|jgi:3-deoxy-D-manno-octulosonic-acid transferase|nr:3-deoxy-D-manno-octulosonic acid transferase [Candidatus Pelagibacter sp.]
MLVIYRFLINLVFLFSPIILFLRLIKKKEHQKRFKEKLCFFSKERGNGKLLWFHGASFGEVQSIIPLIEKFEKRKDINKILITSNTLSSSKIIDKLSFRKVIHQFFPIDTNFHSKKFLNFWKPSAAFFVDSEIWPNMIINLDKKKIPISIINGRITKKTFDRWKHFPDFSNYIFSKINLSLSASKISKIYLRKLGVRNVKYLGNIKFAQSETDKVMGISALKKFMNKRKTWCASSTHYNEEKICGIVHNLLKKKYKNILTIIIPRHIERTQSIKEELNNLGLRTHEFNSKNKIHENTDVYIVNSYGKTKSIYSLCNNVFLGGSIINHGGQNPLEATRYNCNVLHGPNVDNFREIYTYLGKLNVSFKIHNSEQLFKKLNQLFLKKNSSNKIKSKLKKIGDKILTNSYKEINKHLINEL